MGTYMGAGSRLSMPNSLDSEYTPREDTVPTDRQCEVVAHHQTRLRGRTSQRRSEILYGVLLNPARLQRHYCENPVCKSSAEQLTLQ
jgi:hypothetical protein